MESTEENANIRFDGDFWDTADQPNASSADVSSNDEKDYCENKRTGVLKSFEMIEAFILSSLLNQPTVKSNTASDFSVAFPHYMLAFLTIFFSFMLQRYSRKR